MTKKDLNYMAKLVQERDYLAGLVGRQSDMLKLMYENKVLLTNRLAKYEDLSYLAVEVPQKNNTETLYKNYAANFQN